MINTLSKILFFFKAGQRKTIAFIFCCMIITGIIEMGGVAVIFPFISVATKPEVIQTNFYLHAIYEKLGFSDPKQFILFLGAVVFVFFVLGNAFSAFTIWFSFRFSYFKGKEISCDLLNKYLSQPYMFFLNRSSSDFVNTILTEVLKVVSGVFANCLQLFARSFVILFIFTFLIIIDVRLALTVFSVLGIAYFLMYRFVRRRLFHAGKIASEITSSRIQTITETIGAIKELKILGKEPYFKNAFQEQSLKFAKSEIISQLAPLLVRYIIEAIALGGMVLIALYLIATHDNIEKFMPLLGLYALAGYRLMPAMQQVFSGFTSLKYNLAALNKLYAEFQISLSKVAKPLNVSVKIPFEESISIENVSFVYDDLKPRKILNNLNLTINKNNIIGIVGTSGAGKTTLVDIILGLLKPSIGHLAVDNVVVDENSLQAWQRKIGYVPQNIFLLDNTVQANIALGIPENEINHQALENASKLANLHTFISQELIDGYKSKIGERGVCLSGGQRQRIGIARALYHEPELLIFDEATSALDGINEEIIMEAISNLGGQKTIIMIAHRINTVKKCDLIYVLNEGEIQDYGTYSDLLKSNEYFQKLANVRA